LGWTNIVRLDGAVHGSRVLRAGQHTPVCTVTLDVSATLRTDHSTFTRTLPGLDLPTTIPGCGCTPLHYGPICSAWLTYTVRYVVRIDVGLFLRCVGCRVVGLTAPRTHTYVSRCCRSSAAVTVTSISRLVVPGLVVVTVVRHAVTRCHHHHTHAFPVYTLPTRLRPTTFTLGADVTLPFHAGGSTRFGPGGTDVIPSGRTFHVYAPRAVWLPTRFSLRFRCGVHRVVR
jgi:hypothetical protein